MIMSQAGQQVNKILEIQTFSTPLGFVCALAGPCGCQGKGNKKFFKKSIILLCIKSQNQNNNKKPTTTPTTIINLLIVCLPLINKHFIVEAHCKKYSKYYMLYIYLTKNHNKLCNITHIHVFLNTYLKSHIFHLFTCFKLETHSKWETSSGGLHMNTLFTLLAHGAYQSHFRWGFLIFSRFSCQFKSFLIKKSMEHNLEM